MAYQGLAFDIELELLSVNGRVYGFEGDEALDDAGLRFWRGVRQAGRRADLSLQAHPDLLAFWSADRDHLVSSGAHLLWAYLADAVAARYTAMLHDVRQASGDSEALADIAADDQLFILDQIVYAPFRLVFVVSPSVVQRPLELYGFSCLLRDAVASALPVVLGCRAADFIRVRSFLPSPELISAFYAREGEREEVVAPSPEATSVVGDAPSVAVRGGMPLPEPVAHVPGARDWSERFYQLLHPVPVFGFLAACYALFLMLSAEDERRLSPVAEVPPAVVSPSPPSDVPVEPGFEDKVSREPDGVDRADRKVREDSPNVRYVPEN